MSSKLRLAAIGAWLLVAAYYFYQYALRSTSMRMEWSACSDGREALPTPFRASPGTKHSFESVFSSSSPRSINSQSGDFERARRLIQALKRYKRRGCSMNALVGPILFLHPLLDDNAVLLVAEPRAPVRKASAQLGVTQFRVSDYGRARFI